MKKASNQTHLQVASGEVHIWSTSIKTASFELDMLWRVLSEDERKRVNQFYFDRDRIRHIVAHGVLRFILSIYCDSDPHEHHFHQNSYGKPALAENYHLRFNMSHSGDQVLYGITWECEIGVDIEKIRPFENAEQIVERYFSHHEKRAFLEFPAHKKEVAFFAIWTRKEAYIKAQGQGLSLPLDQFTISFLPDEPVRLIETKHNKKERKRWSLHNISIHPDYLAAVAVEGHDIKLCEYQCPSWFIVNRHIP